VRNAAVDGIITLGIGPGMNVLELFRQRSLPFVTIDGGIGENLVNVGIDDVRAAEILMDTVLDAGHREIAVLTLKNVIFWDDRDRFSHTNDTRLAGFERSLVRHGLSFGKSSGIRVYSTEVSIESGKTAVRDALSVKVQPTAIICLADIQAIGAYEECRDRGLSIPQDISIVGFDDIPFSGFMSPPLTTIRQPGFMKGEKAAEALVSLISTQAADSIIMDVELMNRDSLKKLTR